MYDLSRTAVLVDRQPLWLDALEAVLERLQFHVIARASCWNDAERLVREHDPDILVGDAGAAASDGCLPWSALARVKERKPRLKCVVLAEADDRGERERAFAAGADVYCVKASDPADVAVA